MKISSSLGNVYHSKLFLIGLIVLDFKTKHNIVYIIILKFITGISKIMAEAKEAYISILEKKLAELTGIEVDQIKKNQASSVTFCTLNVGI